MQGTAPGVFAPYTLVTRAMVVTTLHRYAQLPPPNSINPFSDVADGQWYTDAITWASENGIVLGYGDGLFGPNDTITREQFITILMRFANFTGIDTAAEADLSGFTDAGTISEYAVNAVTWGYAAGLMLGDSETTLSPTGPATRAMLATILMRFIMNV